MKSKLYYDGNCPVCNSYINLLRKKLDLNKIDLIPYKNTANDFQYVNSKERVYSGNKAIEELASDFPSVTNYFWILPNKYKVTALKAAYKIGSSIRNVLPKKKGCGCKKRI